MSAELFNAEQTPFTSRCEICGCPYPGDHTQDCPVTSDIGGNILTDRIEANEDYYGAIYD